jgi:hypothetical protein
VTPTRGTMRAPVARSTSPAKVGGDYHRRHGKKFAHGYYYPGKHHRHWGNRCWDRRLGCWTYWCPSVCCYYYWCQPACCYYPVTYCVPAPPVVAPPGGEPAGPE